MSNNATMPLHPALHKTIQSEVICCRISANNWRQKRQSNSEASKCNSRRGMSAFYALNGRQLQQAMATDRCGWSRKFSVVLSQLLGTCSLTLTLPIEKTIVLPPRRRCHSNAECGQKVKDPISPAASVGTDMAQIMACGQAACLAMRHAESLSSSRGPCRRLCRFARQPNDMWVRLQLRFPES